MDWFIRLPNESQSILIEFVAAIISIIAIFMGVLITIYQNRKSHQSTLELQQEHLKNEFKKAVHSEIDQVIARLREKESKFFKGLIGIQISLNANRIKLENGVNPSFIKSISYQELSEKYNEFSDCVFDVMAIIEKYEIVEPRLKLFNLVFGLTRQSIGEVFTELSTKHLIDVLPYVTVNKELIPYRLPSEQREYEINLILDSLSEMLIDLGCYIGDLRIEIQNQLLGKLFDKKLKPRKSSDNKYKVITLVSPEYEKLLAHFQKLDSEKIDAIIARSKVV